MNALFIFAGATDLRSSHSKLTEFWRLDREIEKMQNEMSLDQLFHSLEFALLNARAREIVKQLTT